MTKSPLHVVAGILHDARGRVLLAQRPAGKHLAGLWEFPGGKADAGEAPVDALARELREELGIVVESARPLIGVPYRYPDKNIVLDVWQVALYAGEPRAREGQRLAWVNPGLLDRVPMPPADRPAIAALRLPDRYLVTPALGPDQADSVLRGIARACRDGVRMIQLRLPTWNREQLADIARPLRDICCGHGTQLLLHRDWALAAVLGIDGVHLPARTAATLAARPLPADKWVGVSCHDAAELVHAARLGADFATLSPVFATPDHPHAAALGWDGFADLVAAAVLPVYALGGLGNGDLDAAQMSGAQGIAAIRGLWQA